MKTIIIQYPSESDLYELIEKVKQIEASSGCSLAKRALHFYCRKIIQENGTTTESKSN